MKNNKNIRCIYVSLADQNLLKNKETHKVLEDEILVGTEGGDILVAETEGASIFDWDKGLFSGKLIINCNFLPFEILKDSKQTDLFKDSPSASEEEDRIKQEIIAASEEEEENEQAIIKLGLDQSFTEDAIKKMRTRLNDSVKLPDMPNPKSLGGSQFIPLDKKVSTFCLAYVTPGKQAIPLATPVVDGQSFPLVFLKEKAAQFTLDSLSKHPAWTKSVENFQVVQTNTIGELDDIYGLLVSDGLYAVRTMSKLAGDK